MTVVVNPPTNYNHQNPADGHAIMVAVDTMLRAAGLTPVAFTGAYDPAGSSTQLVNTQGTISPWMAYDFSDPAQATHPVTLSVALRYQRAGNTASPSAYNNGVHLPCFRLSEGVDAAGVAQGRVIINTPGDAGGVASTANTDDCFRIRASLGDFCRYDGDSLSFFFGTNGMRFSGTTPTPVSSAFEFHIERRRSAVDDTIQSGFAGMAQPIRLAPSSQFSAYFPTGTNAYQAAQVVNTPVAFVRLDAAPDYTSVGNHVRSGAAMVLSDSGTPVVAPVFYRDADGKPTSLKKMFTIPVIPGSVDGEILSLDFTGVLRPYLYRTIPSTYFGAGSAAAYAHPPLAALFEWEV